MKKILLITFALILMSYAPSDTSTKIYEVRVTTKLHSCSMTDIYTVEARSINDARRLAIIASRSETQTIVNRVTLKR